MKKFLKKFIPSFLISWYHYLLALIGAILYRFPSKKMIMIGVTGTKGKSTVVELATKILEEANYKVASLSSINFKITERKWLNTLKMTMPGRFKLQKFLRQALNAGCQYTVIEVTSEGIKQHRHKFIDFNVAVFTNLAPEHIESHGSFKNYRKAKLKLFKETGDVHIINLDDKNAEYFLNFPADEKYGYGIRNQELRIRNQKFSRDVKIIEATGINLKEDYSLFLIHNSLFKIPLIGKFNTYNTLVAICVGLSQGVSLRTCKRALEKVERIPGRMEFIDEGQDFKVIVDLAHTPDSFEQVFKLVSTLPHKKIISVFGSAGGGRDKWKRPELGKIAAKYSDYIILTNEDPYSENPLKIIEDIESGFSQMSNVKCQMSNYKKIPDRREAIRKGISLAQSNDIVLILGKGTEQIMFIGSKKIPWDDRKVVREKLKNLKIRYLTNNTMA